MSFEPVVPALLGGEEAFYFEIAFSMEDYIATDLCQINGNSTAVL
jgi:hypothetical protein